MRRWLIAAAAALLAGCASAAPPPGGAEDHAPPRLVRVTPDTNAVNVTSKYVTFYFDETINDRGRDAQEIANFFIVSPSDGNARVNWHRSRIEVRPHQDFKPNTAYTVTLLPGLTDLRHNVMTTGASLVFSTGPIIPPLRITGVAFDWVASRPASRAWIEATTPDSTVYLAQADSLGRFSIGPLTAGTYLVRAIIDANGNHAQDRNEAFDTVRVVMPHPAPLELLAIVRDTLPPRLTAVEVADSTSLRVTFDRPLDPSAIPAVTAFRLVAADSSVVPLLAVVTPQQEGDEARASATARADSVKRADSTAARAPAASTSAIPLPATSRKTAPGDKSIPSQPAPPTMLRLRLAHPLAPGTTYRLSVTNARALSGRSMSSERSFTVAKPAPPSAAAETLHPAVRRPAPAGAGVTPPAHR